MQFCSRASLSVGSSPTRERGRHVMFATVAPVIFPESSSRIMRIALSDLSSPAFAIFKGVGRPGLEPGTNPELDRARAPIKLEAGSLV